MIAATAQQFRCDVILTCDVSTFYPMAQEIGCFSALAFADCFHMSESERYIFRYDTLKAEGLYHAKTGKHTKGYQPPSPGHQNGARAADIQESPQQDIGEAEKAETINPPE